MGGVMKKKIEKLEQENQELREHAKTFVLELLEHKQKIIDLQDQLLQSSQTYTMAWDDAAMNINVKQDSRKDRT